MLVEEFQDGCLVLGNLFLSAMPRGVAVANIYVVNQLLNLTLMVDNFLQLLILILIEDLLMLFMVYLEKTKIAPCNMLAKLVDF